MRAYQEVRKKIIDMLEDLEESLDDIEKTAAIAEQDIDSDEVKLTDAEFEQAEHES